MNQEKIKCPECDKKYSKMGIGTHIWRKHTEEGKNFKSGNKKGLNPWNKGLTKETSHSIRKGIKTLKEKYKSGELINFSKGKSIPNERKNRISESMKKAHKEGRASNIGFYKHRKEPSYPEQFFAKVIENEFEDKNYISELRISKYSIDFAWEHKLLAIEIDGEQHERFEKQIQSDKLKTALLESLGWKVLRIRWKDLFNFPKDFIQQAKTFVDLGEIIKIENTKYFEYLENKNKPKKTRVKKEKIVKIKFIKEKLVKPRIKKEKLVKPRIKKEKPNKQNFKKEKFISQFEIDRLNLIEERKTLILNSGIDFDKFGWVGKISEITGLLPQKVNLFMKKYLLDFYTNNCFKRK